MSSPLNRKRLIYTIGQMLIVESVNASTTPIQIYNLCHVKSVEPVFFNSPDHQVSSIIVNFNDGQGNVSKLDIELEHVVNQLSWATPGVITGVNVALGNFITWINDSCGGNMNQSNLTTPRFIVAASKTSIARNSVLLDNVVGNYTAGNVIDTDMNITVTSYPGASAKITGVRAILDGVTTAFDFDVYIFRDINGVYTDDTAFDMSSDVMDFLGVVEFKASNAIASGANTIVFESSLTNAIGVDLMGTDTDVYVVVVSRGTPLKDGAEVYVILDTEENFI